MYVPGPMPYAPIVPGHFAPDGRMIMGMGGQASHFYPGMIDGTIVPPPHGQMPTGYIPHQVIYRQGY